MPDRDDRDVDDLFGDLDEFFAPIEDVDWPESEEEESPATPEGEVGQEEGGDWAPAIDIPGEEDLLGPAAEREPEETGEEEQERVAGAEEAEEAGVSEDEAEREPVESEVAEEPAAEAPTEAPTAADLFEEAEPEPEPEDDRLEEATAEMSGEEWERLRSGLGEDAGGTEEPEEEERAGDLSIEDLRQAPPEYADLPGPGEDEDQEDEEPFVEPVLAEEATFEPEEPPPPPSRPEPEEATSEDVEAAARHFAGGLEPEEVERDLLADLEEVEDEGEAEEAQEVAPPAAAAPEAEPLAGEAPPTWREPAAYEPEEEVAPAGEEAGPPPPTGRNVPAAVASGVILAAAAIALLAIGKGAFVVLAVVLVALGQGELYAVMRTRGYQPATAIGLLAGVVTMAGAYVHGATPGQGEAAVLFGLTLGAVLTVPWYMAAAPNARKGLLANAGVTILGIVLGPVLVSFALILLAAPEVGTNVFLTVVGLTVLYDICAYAIGTMWGDRPLAPTVSPRKSWEGAIGAAFVLVVVSLAVVPSIDPFSAAQAVGLALLISVVAPLGDLVESAIKRDLGVKDMGTLLPGHGGILDRIDAILYTAPAAYFFLRLVA